MEKQFCLWYVTATLHHTATRLTVQLGLCLQDLHPILQCFQCFAADVRLTPALTVRVHTDPGSYEQAAAVSRNENNLLPFNVSIIVVLTRLVPLLA